MKTKNILSLCIYIAALQGPYILAQTNQSTPILCRTSEAMEELYRNDPKARKEAQDFERYTQEYSKNLSNQKNTSTCYVIPVVFHVYGTTQGGYPVNLSIIQGALANWVNKDFQGLNSDYATVHNSFQSIKAAMPDITFALAQLDPNGNPTTGVVNHAVASGYGNGSGYDNLIAADAWDNYKYMNVYIMNDLYNDGVTNNSGVAWYPNTTMSNANTARVVYNGAYLGVNCNGWQPEFASVLTHEFGHWLNLIHTFQGGCVAPNDNVSDTPPCDYSTQQYTCHTSNTANAPLNCNNQLINAENYMDYSGADGCYKMFTQGQVARMYAALTHPARQPLWQQSNLVATGLGNMCNTGIAGASSLLYAGLAPNPTGGMSQLVLSLLKEQEVKVEIRDVMGRTIQASTTPMAAGDNRLDINLTSQPAGVYFIQLNCGNASKSMKLIKE